MSERQRYYQNLPRVLDVPHPYIAIGDLLDISRRFDPKIQEGDTMALQTRFFDIQQEIIPDEASLITTSALELGKKLESVATYEVGRKDKKIGVVIIDRYIAPNTDNPLFFRLNVSRDKERKQVSRPGTVDDVMQQYSNLGKWQKEHEIEEIILMDDALGVGSTLIQTVDEVKKHCPNVNLRAFVGIATSGGEVWSGLERVYKATGIMTEYLTLQKASQQTEASTGLSICNSRDMTMLGGYLQSEVEGVRRSAPHFLPFTITVPKNFTAPYNRALAAELLFEFNSEFIDFIEGRTQRELTLKDLIDKGFGVASSNIPVVADYFAVPTLEVSVRDHLAQAQNVYRRHRSAILNDVNCTQRRISA